jgi:acyl transferase domain-containing protein/acyl carrier protein
MNRSTEDTTRTGLEIAVIGLAARFPGSRTIDEFWENLKRGIESIDFFSEEELLKSGVNPRLMENQNYVRASGVLDDVEYFDAQFFDYFPREAEIMDPQTRIFHECAWHALEDSGYDPYIYNKLIGCYAGASPNFFWEAHCLLSGKTSDLGLFDSFWLYHRDSMANRVAHKLNLSGPVVNVQTACSTSLVAIHMACQGLLNGECDMALAGGITVTANNRRGYIYEEGMFFSPDGHCRAFDAEAKGAVFGCGAGVVVLKRLDDAVEDGDHIYALVKGSSINNDGMNKASFTAPSIEGQAAVIRQAQQMAEVEPESIGYVETQGTGTTLGDPIEIEALKLAFNTTKTGFCGIGSVKTNIGHLDIAAGVASFIKTILALHHRLLPPSLHFNTPNPKIDFEHSPFFVVKRLTGWKSDGHLRRAGVSSFGIGGTNAHAVLEEAPMVPQSANGRPWKLLTISARTEQALDKITVNLTHYLQKNPGIELADASYTLQTGRRFFDHRRMLVCRDVADALEAIDSDRIKSFFSEEKERSVVFMFPGQGAQYVNMGLGLYQTEKFFQEEMDRCFELFLSRMGYDMKEILFSAKEKNPGIIDQTGIAQPAIFIFEYALARLLIRWGITPHFMIGHSIGEYVAATLSGVFTLEDALSLVSIRGQLMQSLSRGAMLSIRLSRDQIKPFLTGTLSLAAVNAPSLCVVSGPIEEIDDLENKLNEKGHTSRRLHTSHAFHSQMMEPILQQFREKAGQITPHEPRIPYLSNLTGKFITLADLTGGEYWAGHLRQTVLFAEGIEELLKKKNCIFIEVGPGTVLSTFCKRLADKNNNLLTVNLVRHPDENNTDDCYLLEKIGQLWLYNVEIDWQAFYEYERRYRISLPPYPFESRPITLKDVPLRSLSQMQTREDILKKKRDIVDWFYSPQWRRSKLPLKQKIESAAPPFWLLFVDETGIGIRITKKLKEENASVVVVRAGDKCSTDKDGGYIINPGRIRDYHDLFDTLRQAGRLPDRIVHLWGVTAADDQDILLDQFKKAQVLGFYSLLYLVKALVHHPVNEDFDINVVSNNRFDVLGEQNTAPGKNTVSGLIKVVSQEYPNIRCRSIDIELPPHKNEEEKLADQMLVELKSDFSDRVVALRNGLRWVQFFEPIPLDKTTPGRQLLREGGVYWFIGGLGEIEICMAEHLSRTVQANLILSHDLSFPAKKEWDHWLSVHPQGDMVSRKIEKLQAMEELGSEVMIVEAVPDNRDQMRTVAAAVRERFPQINGVIYSGSLANIDIYRSIADEDEPHVEQLFKQKVYGLYVLAEILSEMEMDFCLFMSSLSSILGGVGFAAYSSANSFLDAFARQGSQSNPVTFLSLNWDRWRFEGKQPGIPDPTSLTIAEGIEALQRILNWGESGQVAISTTDLQARIDYWASLQTEEDFDLFQPRPNLSTPYVEPREEVEKKLSDIWQKFFGIEQIGINDDFFKLGGDSVKAMTLITKIHKELDTRLPLTEIFKSPTIKGLAGYIKGAIREKYRAIEPAEKKEFYPLFSAQRRLYIVQQMYPEGTGYNVPYTYVLSGELNLELLAATFKKLIWRHESLRTSFQDRDGEVLQKIHDNVEFSIEHDHGEADEKKVIKHFIRPFDLSRPPLLRVGVIRLAEMKHILIADMHHIISDGVSQLILTRDFLDLYSGKELPGLRLQYRDFSEWQQREAGTDEGAYQKQEAYWSKEFSGNIPRLRLPLDYERPGVKDFDGNFVMFSLGEELSTKLYQLARDSDTTLYMILLAAYNVLLNKYTGQEDIIVGSPVPGRPHADLLNIIGMFVNMLAIRNRPGGEKSFNYFLLAVKEKVLGALDNQNYQFEELTKKLGLQGDPGRNPLFDAVFEMQSIDIGENRPAETTLKVAPYPLGENIKAPFDLILSTFENSGLINMRLTYSTRLFKESTIELIIRHYREIAAQITDNPEIRLQDIVLSHQLVKIEPDIEQDSDDDFAFEQVKQ